ncbi:MAG TPA: DUF2520 domain-containing protein [Paludibacteraceae bacterium]|nr:DUF2520 domain-containing protein [Paludibacteraceae bacterium]
MKRVVIVGAGNVATHLGRALQNKNFVVSQIFSRTENSATQLASDLGVPFTTNLQSLDREADIYFYCVNDAVLCDVINKIDIPDALHVHTAGSLPLSIFESHLQYRRYGVFYPLQTFSKTRKVNFDEIPIFVEGNSLEAEEEIRQIAQTLSKRVFSSDSEQRKKIHLSAVFACNFVNHLFSIAEELVKTAGYSFDILLPLITETVNKLSELSPYDAQTGPAVRNDQNIIRQHLLLLENKPEFSEIYSVLSESIYRMHKKDIQTRE